MEKQNGLNMFEEHQKRIRFMDGGGKIKCPQCKDGYIRKMDEDVYYCDMCKCGITVRYKLD